MGVVYRGWDTSLDRPVAIKVVMAERPEARARFLREARAQAKIRHPGVVPIHFVGEDDGVTFIAMELVEGESLASLLEREKVLSADRALAIVDSVAQALDAAAEQGLVHRDVKPSNILVDRRGHCLLADFGLAKQAHAGDEVAPYAALPAGGLGSAKITLEGSLIGTPAYMAPEQAAGKPVDHRADIYALGVTLFEALTGRVPFSAPTFTALLEKQQVEEARPLAELLPDVRPEVAAIVDRMLKKRPEERFERYAELRKAVEAARARPPVHAGLVPRAVGAMIDCVVLAVVVYWPGSATGSHTVALSLCALLAGLVEGQFGTSLGKRLMNLRLAGPGGRPLGRVRALVRSVARVALLFMVMLANDLLPEGPLETIVGMAFAILWLLGLALGFVRPARAPLHDRLCGTHVVYALDRA
jgi:uncharacterized RDD family membrane protein YckC/predicted Ser/Thr protein kinase